MRFSPVFSWASLETSCGFVSLFSRYAGLVSSNDHHLGWCWSSACWLCSSDKSPGLSMHAYWTGRVALRSGRTDWSFRHSVSFAGQMSNWTCLFPFFFHKKKKKKSRLILIDRIVSFITFICGVKLAARLTRVLYGRWLISLCVRLNFCLQPIYRWKPHCLLI